MEKMFDQNNGADTRVDPYQCGQFPNASFWMGRPNPSRRNFSYLGPPEPVRTLRPEFNISEKEQVMSRFVEVESNLINVDHIVRVRQHKNYALSIYLDNGSVIKTDYACERVLEDIIGCDFIVGTVPCEGVSVAIDNGEGTRLYPVRQLALTGDGEVRPLSVQFDRIEFFDEWSGYGGMTHTRPPAEETGP